MATDPVRKEYTNPPIEEGMCQVTFATPLDWSVATPGLLFERLRGQYPVPPEEQAQMQMQASVDAADGQQGSANFAVNRGPKRYVFRDTTKTRLVVASDTTLSVNSLRPYEGWPQLRIRLGAALKSLEEVTSLPPVTQVSVRYINRISVPRANGVIDSDDYFRVTVQTAQSGKASFAGFVHRVESVLTDEATKVLSTFASLEGDPSSVNFLMDLDLIRADLDLHDIDAILVVADDLKALENAEFEGCITDKARDLFS